MHIPLNDFSIILVSFCGERLDNKGSGQTETVELGNGVLIRTCVGHKTALLDN